MRSARALVGLVLLVAGCGAANAAAPVSGIVGRIVAGPVCPVETVPPQPRCAPRPLAAAVQIGRVGSRSPVKLVRSSADGRFRIRLTPGTYLVRALRQDGSPFPRPPSPFHVRVRTGRFTYITVIFDTGIR